MFVHIYFPAQCVAVHTSPRMDGLMGTAAPLHDLLEEEAGHLRLHSAPVTQHNSRQNVHGYAFSRVKSTKPATWPIFLDLRAASSVTLFEAMKALETS